MGTPKNDRNYSYGIGIHRDLGALAIITYKKALGPPFFPINLASFWAMKGLFPYKFGFFLGYGPPFSL